MQIVSDLHYTVPTDAERSRATMKYHMLLLISAAAAYPHPGVVEDQVQEKYDLIGESGHQQHVQHEHAKSHQSIKFEHFHPVPVYVKKEYQQLLHHPLEKGKSESDLKQIHPEIEHHHGGGLVLEDHRFNTDHVIPQHGGFEGYEGPKGYELQAHDQQLFQPAYEGFKAEGY